MAVLIDENTKIICQGLIGPQETFHTELAIVADDQRDGPIQTVKSDRG